MAISIQDQQRIFLAYRALFEGNNAQVRQPKAIRKILSPSKNSSLVQSFGFEKVVAVLKTLLERGIFSSELKAKLAFPVLYETSPEQDARHEASDAGAAKEEAEALQEVEALDNAAVEDVNAKVFDFEDASLNEESKLPAAVESAEDPQPNDKEHLDMKQESSVDVPLLYPVQFPFKVQHAVLSRSQQLLEESCFEFTQKHAPGLLIERKWDCSEAIELNKWTFMMMKRHGKLPAGAFKKPDSDIHASLLAVNKLRHAAVHRLRISAKGIVQMVDAAMKFTETLSDSVRASQLEELCQELKSKIKSQELNKNYLETKLKEELDKIKRQREELAERERAAISTMVIEDEDNMRFVGSLLEGSLPKILGGDSADDELDGFNPDDHLDDGGAEATDEASYKEDIPKGPEAPRLIPNRVKTSDENDANAEGSSTVKENTVGFQYVKSHSSNTQRFDYKSLEFTPGPNASRKHNNYSSNSAKNTPSEETLFNELTTAEPEPESQLQLQPELELKLQPELEPEPQPEPELQLKLEPELELQPEPTMDEANIEFPLVSEKTAEEPDYWAPATEMQPEVETLVAEPLQLPTQNVPIANAIRDILKRQEIDTTKLRRKIAESERELHRRAYDSEMKEIKTVVSENLRRRFESDTFETFIVKQIEDFCKEKESEQDRSAAWF